MRLAVVEDDRALCARVAGAIRSAGHNCTEFHSGDALQRSLRRESYDLVVVDERIADMPSAELLGWMRNTMQSSPSIILLTRNECQRNHGSDFNPADDCIQAPDAVDHINDHVDAVLRKRFAHVDASGSCETFGAYAFDTAKRSVTMNGAAISVTAKEFALALLFFRNLGRPLSRAHLMEAVWGRLLDQGSRTLDAHVSQIRNHLRLGPENGLRLGSIYGFGYKLERS
jgi:DNA-binding response OmpR family regulator